MLSLVGSLLIEHYSRGCTVSTSNQDLASSFTKVKKSNKLLTFWTHFYWYPVWFTIAPLKCSDIPKVATELIFQCWQNPVVHLKNNWDLKEIILTVTPQPPRAFSQEKVCFYTVTWRKSRIATPKRHILSPWWKNLVTLLRKKPARAILTWAIIIWNDSLEIEIY